MSDQELPAFDCPSDKGRLVLTLPPDKRDDPAILGIYECPKCKRRWKIGIKRTVVGNYPIAVEVPKPQDRTGRRKVRFFHN